MPIKCLTYCLAHIQRLSVQFSQACMTRVIYFKSLSISDGLRSWAQRFRKVKTFCFLSSFLSFSQIPLIPCPYPFPLYSTHRLTWWLTRGGVENGYHGQDCQVPRARHSIPTGVHLPLQSMPGPFPYLFLGEWSPWWPTELNQQYWLLLLPQGLSFSPSLLSFLPSTFQSLEQ